jgi:hypothetical protein
MKIMQKLLVVVVLGSIAATGCMADLDEAGGEAVDSLESQVMYDGPIDGSDCGDKGPGSPFHTANFDPNDRIVAVQVRSHREIDGIAIFYQSGRVERWGGEGGILHEPFVLGPDEVLLGFEGRHGYRIDSLAIKTNQRTSLRYGGSGGWGPYNVRVPSGTRMLGIYGHASSRLCKIGVVYDRR